MKKKKVGEGIQIVSCPIPYSQYKLLYEIADVHALSISKLLKIGIRKVIEEYTVDSNEGDGK